MKYLRLTLLAAAVSMISACASTPSGKSSSVDDCEKSIKNYSKLIRWAEPEKAGLAFVDMKQRPVFSQAVEKIKKREINFTDFRIVIHNCAEDKKAVEAVVEFDYYQLTNGKLKTVTDRQSWVYQNSTDGSPAGWWLTSPLPEFK